MIYRPLIRLTDRIRGLLAVSGVISLLSTSVIIVQMVWLSRIIHDVFMEDTARSDVHGLLLLLLGAILARALLTGCSQSINQRGAIRIKSELRDRLFEHLLCTGPVTLKNERTGELTSTLTEGLEKIDAYYARYLPRAMHVMIAPLLIAVVVLTIDPLSGAILLCTGPLIPLFMWLIGSMAEKRTQKQWSALSRMSAYFLDVLQGLTTLKLFGAAAAREKDIRRISNRYRLTTMGVLKIAFLSGLVLELAASLSTAIVAVQIGVRLVEGHIPFQLGLFVLLLAPEFYLPFRQLGAEHHAALEGRAAADRVFAALEIPTPHAPAHAVAAPAPPFDITLRDVSLRYPGRESYALHNVTATIAHGRVTALVGHSGAGKSTLFHLLCRYLDPESGVIRAGETDLLDLDQTVWRRRLAVVAQFPALYRGTVMENLRMARPDATIEDLRDAAALAEAHDVIARLPDGYETMLGEQGWRLSGGERQRLALARAFLKDAPILLMDEPASNLDPESEEKIGRAFERLSRNRTVLVIAHRLRTIYRADHILVLEHGRLAEQGAHAELAKRNGAYAGLLRRAAR